MGDKLIDRTGKRYGRLVVMERADDRAGRVAWRCQCDCGTVKVVTANKIQQGTSSCGCLARESMRRVGLSNATHGHTRGGNSSSEYRTWSGMWNRCTNPNSADYARYGGRGIRVCERWDDFDTFLADMGPKPSPTHSIDRIDNDGNYAPGNCRWALPTDQSRNQRTNHLITIGQRTMTTAEWAEEVGLKADTLRHRLAGGMSPERAISPRRLSRWESN